MILLFESGDSAELEKHRMLFESKGIPIFISSTKSFGLSQRVVGYKKGFWIYLDSQFLDAQALLKNRNHVIKNPADMTAFNLYKRNFDKDFSEMISNKLENFFNYLVVFIALCICLWIALTIFYA